MGENSMIHADNIWGLWAVLTGVAACAIILEQKYTWASRITGCVIALGGMMLLSNLGIIPTASPVYDCVWDYIVPLSIPLLLFRCNIKKIGRESGRFLLIFLLSSLGTLLGAVIGFPLLKTQPGLEKICALFTGSYVGGSVNFAAMADTFAVSGGLASAAVVADNLLMALYFFVLSAIPSIGFFRKKYKTPFIDEVSVNQSSVASYWKGKEISLKDIALDLAIAVGIVAIASQITKLGGIFSNKYLIIATITMCCATFLPKIFENMPGANEIGTFLIYLFFAVIGAPASILVILRQSPILLVYAMVIVTTNLIVSLIFGKIFRFNLEEIILASNANIGGPTTAAAMAISRGWNVLVGPAILVGTLGYVLGNYYGLLIGFFLIR